MTPAVDLKVLLIAYHFPPMNSSGVQRPLAMLKLLPRFGVSVSVLTHTYSRTDLRSDPRILRVYDTNSRRFGKLLHYPMRLLQKGARALGASTSWHAVWSRGIKRRADVIFDIVKPDMVISTYPPIETFDLGLYFSEKYGVPLIADFRDGLLFEPIEPLMLRSPGTRARYERLERRVASQAAAIVTVSDPISEYFRSEYRRENVVTIPNGYDPDEEWTAPQAHELDRSKFNLVYTGRLGLSEKGRAASDFTHAVTQLVEAEPAIADRLRIHFVGELSPAEKKLLQPLVKLGIVHLHGLVDRGRSLGFQRAATMLLLVASSGKASVATGKLFEYLQTGRPILGLTRKTAAEAIILRTGTGITVDPEDRAAIRATLTRVVLNRQPLDLERRSDEIEKYSRLRQMDSFASLLRTVASTGVSTRA